MKSFFLRKRKKLLLLFVLPSIVFIIFYESRPQEVGISKYQDEDTLAQMAYTPVNDEEQQRRLPPPDLQQHQNNVSHSDNSAMQHKNIELDNKGRADLIEWVHQSNQNLVIRNRHLIDPILANVSHQEYNGTLRNISYNHLDESSIHKFLVILVQVHKRLNNLQALIESLRFTKHIEQVLLVFSHDFYDPKINELIATIDFCAVSHRNYKKQQTCESSFSFIDFDFFPYHLYNRQRRYFTHFLCKCTRINFRARRRATVQKK